jgi:hypothetical protein
MERAVVLAKSGECSTLLRADGAPDEFVAWKISAADTPTPVLSIAEANFVISRSVKVLEGLDEGELATTFVAHHGSDGFFFAESRAKLLGEIVKFSHGIDRLWKPHGQNLLDEFKRNQPSGIQIQKSFDGLLVAFKDFDGRVHRAAVRFLDERVKYAYRVEELKATDLSNPFDPQADWSSTFDPQYFRDEHLLSELPAIAADLNLEHDWADSLGVALEEIRKVAQSEGPTAAALLSSDGGFCKFRDELLGSDDGRVKGIVRRIREAIALM